MEKKTEAQEKIFCTEYDGEDGRYAGPYIKAASWEEARAKAREAIRVIGELATS